MGSALCSFSSFSSAVAAPELNSPTYICTGKQTAGFLRNANGQLEPTSSSPLLNFIVYPHDLTDAEKQLPPWDQAFLVYHVKASDIDKVIGDCSETTSAGELPAFAAIDCTPSSGQLTLNSFKLFESILTFEFENSDYYDDGDGNSRNNPSKNQDNPYIEVGDCIRSEN